MKPKVHFTDGEGPIVYKDLAADITGKITFPKVSGDQFFSILSLYDDYLAETGTEGYQAGDTLALVVPHFLAHGINDKDILREAKEAKLCFGVEDYIAGLKKDGWELRIISTAYSPMWELIGAHLQIPMQHIACTHLNLKTLRDRFGRENFYHTIRKFEDKIISLMPLAKKAMAKIDRGQLVEKIFGEDPEIIPLTQTLNNLYWVALPKMGYPVLKTVRVMGGIKKVTAAQKFAANLGVNLADVSYTGDSITDDKIHKFLRSIGGLPIGLNGNRYALRNARVAIATTDMRNIRPILDAWVQDGITAVQKFIRKPSPQSESTTRYDIIQPNNPENFAEIVSIHKKFRTTVRGQAARLG